VDAPLIDAEILFRQPGPPLQASAEPFFQPMTVRTSFCMSRMTTSLCGCRSFKNMPAPRAVHF